MYTKIKEFLNLLNGHYYIFGGMALSKILRDVNSYDWDIQIDKDNEDIKSVKRKLDQVFDNVICQPVSFTRSYVGEHSVIYQCGIGNEIELFDFKFEDIRNTPTVILNGLKYLDIEGLYYNLVDSIKDNQMVLDDFNVKMKKFNRDSRGIDHISDYLINKIREQTEEIEGFMTEAEDDEEMQEYIEELEKINSQEYYDNAKEELIEYLNGIQGSKIKAEKLIAKNSKRLHKLREAVSNPYKFTLGYTKNLFNECYDTDGTIRKQIGDIQFKCSNLD